MGRIQVEGGTEDDKTVFYSSFYRTFERPICMSEDGRYFSAFDGKVHEDNGTPFYTDDWIWDTYRAAHPLRTTDRPTKGRRHHRILPAHGGTNGQYVDAYFPEVTGDTRRMNSNHAVATVADALAKGLKVDTAKPTRLAGKGLKKRRSPRGREHRPAGWTISTVKTVISPLSV